MTNHKKTFPGPYTDAQIIAHLEDHKPLPGGPGHTPEGMEQISKMQRHLLAEKFRKSEQQRQARVKLLKDQERKLQSTGPHLRIIKAQEHRGRGYALIEVTAPEDTSCTDFRILFRPDGEHGWAGYGQRIYPNMLPHKTAVILKVDRIYELCIRGSNGRSYVYSKIMPVTFRKQEVKKVEKVQEEVVPVPTDEQIRLHLSGEKPLKKAYHETIRKAIWVYQKKEQERKIREHEAGQAARDAEVERQLANFRKWPERDRKVKAAPPALAIARETRYSVKLRLSRHDNNVCDHFQLMRRWPGQNWVASGRAFKVLSTPRTTWRRRGKGVELEFCIRASNKYSHVFSNIIRIKVRG